MHRCSRCTRLMCHCEEQSDAEISRRHWHPTPATMNTVCTDCVCSGGQRPPLAVTGFCAPSPTVQCPQICHCEAPTGPWQSREGSCDFADGIPTMRLRTARLPRRFAPRNDNSGKCRGAPMPFSGLRPLYKALTERRYTPYFGFYHFTDSLYKSAVQCRAGTALPLQWRLPF